MSPLYGERLARLCALPPASAEDVIGAVEAIRGNTDRLYTEIDEGADPKTAHEHHGARNGDLWRSIENAGDVFHEAALAYMRKDLDVFKRLTVPA